MAVSVLMADLNHNLIVFFVILTIFHLEGQIGSGSDEGYSAKQVNDGGYIISGVTITLFNGSIRLEVETMRRAIQYNRLQMVDT
jgi:hypothetical protein